MKGDEASLQMALNMVHSNRYEYVSVLFYASWCPFSKSFRPSFSILSSLYASIPHFAIQESAVRPRFHIKLTFSNLHYSILFFYLSEHNPYFLVAFSRSMGFMVFLHFSF